MSQRKQENEIDLQDLQTRGEKFVNENKTMVSAVVGGILLIALAWFGFTKVYLPNQENQAMEDMFVAQQNFAKDSFSLALNGDGNYPGFLEIIDSYSGFTKASNLAHYYAGICQLQLGDADAAIDHLSSFSSNDRIVSSVAMGAIGDAYAQKGDLDQSVSYYKKAANNDDNEFTASMYLSKAARTLEHQESFAEAKEVYEELKERFPESTYGKDADKFIARVESRL